MTIYIGDSLTWLKKLPSESVNCIVTSPPYFQVRDYGVDGQYGLEETPQEFVDNMVAVFREARRVLRNDGTAWVNLGDTFLNKQLLMIPHRFAIAMQDDGWIIRNDIVWSKGNPMPESVTDRCTKSHEYIFLCAKSERYYFDADAIREQGTGDTRVKPFGITDNSTFRHDRNGREYQVTETRNKRDVWTINTESSGVAHFATMPSELAETCIKAGCPETVCAECGAPYVRETENSYIMGSAGRVKGLDASNGWNGFPRATKLVHTRGFNPSCTCNGATANGIVLDPFGGAGTTALAAIHLNRNYQLIELNIKYVGIAQKRIAAFNPMQDTVLPDGTKQLSLFRQLEVSA